MTSKLKNNLSQVFVVYPDFKQKLEKMTNTYSDTCCLWHRKGVPGHKGNFGLMGECLDCLAEIEKGRCTIDVKNFDPDIYWPVRGFWLKVDIRSPDECWPWLGATRKTTQRLLPICPAHSTKAVTSLLLVLRSGLHVATLVSNGLSTKKDATCFVVTLSIYG